ncbi:RNA helicase [Xanthoria calcicola]
MTFTKIADEYLAPTPNTRTFDSDNKGTVQVQTKEPEFGTFLHDVVAALNKSLENSEDVPPIVHSLHRAFLERGRAELRGQIKYAYHGFLTSQRFTETNLQDQAKLADLRYPAEWYPGTREIQRTIHLHVGPTNSGKTYHALQRLEQAESGIYAGPLRLLAHEVYTRLNARGKPCNLITGDERQLVEGNVSMSSCTVEMVPVHLNVDVAVIDEIQMIGHEERGWAWTQAVMGLRAKELHLCGEERTVPLIKELAAAMGDDLRIHHYKRLSPLKTMSASLRGDLNNLRKGDCVVAFSKVSIHGLKDRIERTTGKRVAVIYGSLPPEIRAQQAGLFNDPTNDYDILVASDAIGMGLNLSIKRIIFSSTMKFNGRIDAPIDTSQIKQIAGRAGRYRTATQAAETSMEGSSGPDATKPRMSPDVSPAQTLGLVTTLDREGLSTIQKAMTSQADPIMSAGIFPPDDVLIRFAAYFPPSTPFSYILIRLHNTSLLHPRFHLCILKDHIKVADAIEPVRNLTVSDRITFCASPASIRDKDDPMIHLLRELAECVATNSGGGILDIPRLKLKWLETEVTTGSRLFLEKLEALHKGLILYLWLSYRFAGVFNTQAMAFYIKSLVEKKIHEVLSRASFKPRRIMNRRRRVEPEDDNPDEVDEGVFSRGRSDQQLLYTGFGAPLELPDRAKKGREHESPSRSDFDLVASLRGLKTLQKSVEAESTT